MAISKLSFFIVSLSVSFPLFGEPCCPMQFPGIMGNVFAFRLPRQIPGSRSEESERVTSISPGPWSIGQGYKRCGSNGVGEFIGEEFGRKLQADDNAIIGFDGTNKCWILDLELPKEYRGFKTLREYYSFSECRLYKAAICRTLIATNSVDNSRLIKAVAGDVLYWYDIDLENDKIQGEMPWIQNGGGCSGRRQLKVRKEDRRFVVVFTLDPYPGGIWKVGLTVESKWMKQKTVPSEMKDVRVTLDVL